jgi:hypothetical protein
MDLIASAASILNGIVTKFTIPIHCVSGNVYRQFPKHVIKNTSNGMMMGNQPFQRNFKRSNSKFTIPGEGI